MASLGQTFGASREEDEYDEYEDEEEYTGPSTSDVITSGDIVSGVCSPTRKSGPVPKMIFLVDFLDGYSIRQFIEIVKLTLMNVPMFLTPHGITIQRGNGPKTLVLNSEFHQHNLPFYYFDEKLASVPGTAESPPCHIICPNIVKLREAIRSVARKEGIRLYQYAGESVLHVHVYGGSKTAGDGGGAIVPLETFEHIQYNLGDGFRQPFSQPNFRIPLAEFCGFCTAAARFRGVIYVEVRTYNKGVVLISKDSSDRQITDKKWGDCDDSNRVPIDIPGGPRIIFQGDAPKGSSMPYYSCRVPIDVIKALSKMCNLVVNGILRIYAERDGLIRVQTMVNYYGPLTFYLRDDDRVLSKK